MSGNHLKKEKSPYLLQHADNPVDWYPWGEAAFEKARREEKPVFLSIGYSTCHWCHVMAHESFEDSEVAELLNREYVAVKVDREERPDVDTVYMSVCQAMTGSGGWPLTILMTPEKKPFYAGTYLPKNSRWGILGLKELLEETARLWHGERTRLLEAGGRIAGFLSERRESPGKKPEKKFLHEAFRLLSAGFDRKNGGFGQAPKFPSPHILLFLLRYSELEKSREAREMAEKTLIQMARGGIFDQVGGGFSRYSTDERWLVPHFEKMLYDNALLSYVYLEAYRMTGLRYYRTTASRTLDYVSGELRVPEGGFACGQDADSDGVEGKYYVFTRNEIVSALGGGDGPFFCDWFGIEEEGNFEGKSIPNLLANLDYGRPDPALDGLCQKLDMYRRSRTELHRDDKVLTSWNSMMMAAFSKAFLVTGDNRYLEEALGLFRFIRTNLKQEDGRLFVRWRDKEAAYNGNLDDYAYYAWALLELYGASFDVGVLEEAVQTARMIKQLFFDEELGGCFFYDIGGETLLSRPKELYDGAVPSGNSVAAFVFGRLWRLTGETKWRDLSDRQLNFIAGNMDDYPAGHCFALLAMAQELYPSCELVCALSGERIPEGLREFAQEYHVPTVVKTSSNARQLARTASYTEKYPIPGQGEAYYLCQDGSCLNPVTDLWKLRDVFPFCR